MNVEVLSSQILGKIFSEFPNRSQTHDLPEYRLERSQLSTVVFVFIPGKINAWGNCVMDKFLIRMESRYYSFTFSETGDKHYLG